jgi:hypothetical protein
MTAAQFLVANGRLCRLRIRATETVMARHRQERWW